MFLWCIFYMFCNFFRLKMDYEIYENLYQNSFFKIFEDVLVVDLNIFIVVIFWW